MGDPCSHPRGGKGLVPPSPFYRGGLRVQGRIQWVFFFRCETVRAAAHDDIDITAHHKLHKP